MRLAVIYFPPRLPSWTKHTVFEQLSEMAFVPTSGNRSRSDSVSGPSSSSMRPRKRQVGCGIAATIPSLRAPLDVMGHSLLCSSRQTCASFVQILTLTAPNPCAVRTLDYARCVIGTRQVKCCSSSIPQTSSSSFRDTLATIKPLAPRLCET